MTRSKLTLALAMGLLAASACNKNESSDTAAKGAAAVKEAVSYTHLTLPTTERV